MMYLDSAIIVKLLVRETDSVWFDEHLAGTPVVKLRNWLWLKFARPCSPKIGRAISRRGNGYPPGKSF